MSINSVSSWLPLPSASDKVTLSRKMASCLSVVQISDHKKLSEESSLILCHWQDIFKFHFTMHPSSSSNSHCKLKSLKILSDLSLDKPSHCFLVVAYMKQETFCSYPECLWNRKGRPETLRPLLSLLGCQTQGLASLGQNVSLNQNS